MFLMQQGEKKLRDLMKTKTVDKKDAIVYLMNLRINRDWKRNTFE